MTTIVRGNTITFTGTCLDAAGAPATPATAILKLVYTLLSTGVLTTESVSMTINSNIVTYDWDSSVAAADGKVRYSIQTTGGRKLRVDDEITLSANEANL